MTEMNRFERATSISMQTNSIFEIQNGTFRLEIGVDRQVNLRLSDAIAGTIFADAAYVYRLGYLSPHGTLLTQGLTAVQVSVQRDSLTIRGQLAGLDIRHELQLPHAKPWLEEHLSITNNTRQAVQLNTYAFGMQRRLTNRVGQIFPELGTDRIVAIPFRHRAADPANLDMDFAIAELLTKQGRAPRVHFDKVQFGFVPARVHASEGWAWTRASGTLGIFKFNQNVCEFSILEMEVDEDGAALRFAGAAQLDGQPDALLNIRPSQTVEFGATRIIHVAGDYVSANYAFRDWLDENDCRFPAHFDPPVHWNELYDNAEWAVSTPGYPPLPRRTRPYTFTKELILEQAAKAKAYGCQALYLDPGWDNEFGTLIWGAEWLGDLKAFIAQVREQYGLSVSLHCPLASWVSIDGRGTSSWPPAAQRMTADGQLKQGMLCLASNQYRDEAVRRILALCAGGVRFIMMDGNAWPGECWNPDHGHAVPMTFADHYRANLDIAQRIHAEYPSVLIEMHDPIVGGARMRYSPVYFGYGLPGSFDMNWGFELMWQPLEDIRSGRARSLYYYNLGCNVPIYLHVDLRGDNEHNIVLWWYASTCRHLGIGGTHPNFAIAAAHRKNMERYRELERFFKVGEFYGLSEEFHIHVLRTENAFVVNLFNLSDESRLISGTIPFAQIGLDRNRWYVSPYTHEEGRFNRDAGTCFIQRRLAPWAAEVIHVYSLPTPNDSSATADS